VLESYFARPCGLVSDCFGRSSFATQGDIYVLYMVVERFKNSDAKAVYRRFRDHGRMAPEGLSYLESWVETNFDRCFQLMESDDPKLLEEWAAHWRDLVDIEFVPVRRSKEAVAVITPEL
jgi:hypothetical protein